MYNLPSLTASASTNKNIIDACYSENLVVLNNYYQLGIDLNNIYDNYGDGLLNISIFMDSPTLFNSFAQWGLDIESHNVYTGETPLHVAALMGYNQYISNLVSLGADVNSFDYTGFTPLLNAMWFMEYNTAEYLLTFDAVDVNLPSNYGLTPLILAYLDDEWQTIDSIINHPTYDATFNYLILADKAAYDLLCYLEAQEKQGDLDIIEAFEAVKLLGLRYELDGEFSFSNYDMLVFEFEGYGNQQGINAFNHAYQDYYDNIISHAVLPDWAGHVFATVYESIAFSAATFDAEAYLSRYLDHNPVLIPSGWDEHSIEFVLHGDRLYRCNRGYLGDEKYGIEEFIITKPENITADLIDFMLAANGSPDFLQHDLINVLGLEKVGQVETQPQLVGNCVWASLEAGFEALLITSLLETGLDSDSAHLLAKQNYLIWENYDLMLGLNELIQYEDILIENELYDNLLLQVLESSHDAANVYDVEKGKLILDILTEPEHYSLFDQAIGQYVNQYDLFSFQQISYMEEYETDLGNWDWLMNTTGAHALTLPADIYEKGNEYYQFLLACDSYDTSLNQTVLSLNDLFADYDHAVDLSNNLAMPMYHESFNIPLHQGIFSDLSMPHEILV